MCMGKNRGPRVTRYQALAVTTVVATLVLITIGAVVRTTGSGLGCPDWPLCHGQLLPPAERTAIIEYTHRSAAAVVGLLIVAFAAVSVLRRRGDSLVRNLAVAAVVLLAGQAWLGKETVERELPPEIVTAHLGTALTLTAVLSVLAVFAFSEGGRRRIKSRQRASFVRLATVTAAILLAVLLGGSYVVGADATTACTTWPGCLQAPIPFADGLAAQHIHWAHRLSTLAGFGAVGLLALNATTLEGPRADALRMASMTLLALYGVQMLIGALNIITTFSDIVRATHLAAAAAIWALAVLIAVAASYEPAGEPEGAGAPSAAGGGRQPARA